MQSVDFTTLVAVCNDLKAHWLPARVEQVYQCDRSTIAIALRTMKERGWLTVCWHPQAARICMGDAPPKIPDTFTFSDQLRHQLNGYALIGLEIIAPWERVVDCQFAQRPGDSIVWHLYIEIMGKYSNVILTDGNQQIITVAHQVTANQSRVRTVQTGQIYELPPALMGRKPSLTESQNTWQERVSLIPGKIEKQLLENYRGLSPVIAKSLCKMANVPPQQITDRLTDSDWDKLYYYWQQWLTIIEKGEYQPGWMEDGGYNVLGWGITKEEKNIHNLLTNYYKNSLNLEQFQQLRHQLIQKINNLLGKLGTKAEGFRKRLEQSNQADKYKQNADLLMANIHHWQPGMQEITLNDFETGKPVNIPLNPEKNAVQNAQALYKQHQKLKRVRSAVLPLLQEVISEIKYLEQVEASLTQLEKYHTLEDLETLEEIRQELIHQGYLEAKQQSNPSTKESKPYCYQSPSGFEIWIGRNNRQNDQLTFRLAGDYDLWFHSQEIAGSHVLLRLKPGSVPDDADLQRAADWAAYYSRARQSQQVPVVYTQPKYVYKPKGAKPGMVVYRHERVLWGCPQRVGN